MPETSSFLSPCVAAKSVQNEPQKNTCIFSLSQIDNILALCASIINSSHLLKSTQKAHCSQLPFVALQNDEMLMGVVTRSLGYMMRLQTVVGWLCRN
jgi:hypothetical protein